MAFTKKTWKDRIAQYINRRRLVDTVTGNEQVVGVLREEGSVSEAGDAFSAANMNDLEDRIDTAFGALTGSNIPVSDFSTDTIEEVISKIDTKLTDYVKVKYFSVTIADSTRNMDLSAKAQAIIDNGYKFLTYISVVPTNFTTDNYVWLSRPWTIQGQPWWNTNPIPGSTPGSTTQLLTYIFLEIRI